MSKMILISEAAAQQVLDGLVGGWRTGEEMTAFHAEQTAAIAVIREVLANGKSLTCCPEDERIPTSHRDRFADAVALLCQKRAPEEMIDSWLDKSADDLQSFAIEHGPAWGQGIVVLDAAHVLASSPGEGVDHEILEESGQLDEGEDGHPAPVRSVEA